MIIKAAGVGLLYSGKTGTVFDGGFVVVSDVIRVLRREDRPDAGTYTIQDVERGRICLMLLDIGPN